MAWRAYFYIVLIYSILNNMKLGDTFALYDQKSFSPLKYAQSIGLSPISKIVSITG
ncbi:hypothetical protein SAMN06298216_4428 [Spirosomataceae bacterium TFI 002]|nr:hypothetical protein SAMN06298216_4428 [Spirosomataceae bacterium TFI 002]